jgi:hypothetical protein
MKVEPGNLYAAQGGKPTRYWLVLAVNATSCPMLGLDENLNIVSAHTYALHAMERRPVLDKIDLGQVAFLS